MEVDNYDIKNENRQQRAINYNKIIIKNVMTT